MPKPFKSAFPDRISQRGHAGVQPNKPATGGTAPNTSRLQSKAGGRITPGSHPATNVSQPRKIAAPPPVYRPELAAHIVQPQTIQKFGPPVYRVVQSKQANSAPPVYRPEPPSHIAQLKRIRQGPPVYRPGQPAAQPSVAKGGPPVYRPGQATVAAPQRLFVPGSKEATGPQRVGPGRVPTLDILRGSGFVAVQRAAFEYAGSSSGRPRASVNRAVLKEVTDEVLEMESCNASDFERVDNLVALIQHRAASHYAADFGDQFVTDYVNERIDEEEQESAEAGGAVSFEDDNGNTVWIETHQGKHVFGGFHGYKGRKGTMFKNASAQDTTILEKIWNAAVGLGLQKLKQPPDAIVTTSKKTDTKDECDYVRIQYSWDGDTDTWSMHMYPTTTDDVDLNIGNVQV